MMLLVGEIKYCVNCGHGGTTNDNMLCPMCRISLVAQSGTYGQLQLFKEDECLTSTQTPDENSTAAA